MCVFKNVPAYISTCYQAAVKCIKGGVGGCGGSCVGSMYTEGLTGENDPYLEEAMGAFGGKYTGNVGITVAADPMHLYYFRPVPGFQHLQKTTDFHCYTESIPSGCPLVSLGVPAFGWGTPTPLFPLEPWMSAQINQRDVLEFDTATRVMGAGLKRSPSFEESTGVHVGLRPVPLLAQATILDPEEYGLFETCLFWAHLGKSGSPEAQTAAKVEFDKVCRFYLACSLLEMFRARPLKGVTFTTVSTASGVDAAFPSAVATKGAVDVNNYAKKTFSLCDEVYVLPAFRDLNEEVLRLGVNALITHQKGDVLDAKATMQEKLRDLLPRMCAEKTTESEGKISMVPGLYAVPRAEAWGLAKVLMPPFAEELMSRLYLGTCDRVTSDNSCLSVRLDLKKTA